MSILNRPSQGQPSILVALAQIIWASDSQSLTFDELLSRAAPPSLTDQKQARGALSSWLKLGLFSQNKSGEISFANALPELPHLRPHTLLWLRAAARYVALRPENNDPFWATKHVSTNEEDAADGPASDLTRGATWLLAQSLDVRLATYRQAESLAGKQLSNAQLVLQNDTRWKPLVDWMLFLGLGLKGPDERPRVNEENPSILLIDPTEAISDLLPEIFSEQPELPQGDFFSELAKLLPVVDGGAYRQELEKRTTDQWPGLAKGRLSPSLSRALLRLESARQLKLLEKSDAGQGRSDSTAAPIELWFGAKETRRITHLSLKKTSK